MTAVPGAATRVTAAGVCCLVATLAYSGAVTLTGLLAFVLPSVVAVTGVTAAVARLSLRLAVAAGLVAALVVAEVVNLVSGSGHGPAARSTFAAAAFAVLAVAAVLGPAPALFAAAVVGVVVGALGLGAGAEVAPVAVATAVTTVVALALVEAQARRWKRRSTQLAAVLPLALLVGAVVVTAALQADRHLDGAPTSLAPGAVQPTIRPPAALGDPNPRPTASPTPIVNPTQRPDSGARPPADEADLPLRTIWLVVALVVLAVVLGAALRILWVALAWRLLRRRLRRGSGGEQVAGAWMWSTRRLRAAGWPVPASLSPDAVAAGHGIADLPRLVRAPLRQVARSTVDVMYAPPVEECDPRTAWGAADEVGREAISALPVARRLGFAVRAITSVPSRSAAFAPATPEENRS